MQIIRFTLSLLLVALIPHGVGADLILQASAVTTSLGENSPVEGAINQSGLSFGYTSGVTDFDSYIASNPTHMDRQATPGLPVPRFRVPSILISAALTLSMRSHFWNLGSNFAANVTGFTLEAGTDSSFSNSIFLGSFTADPNTGPNAATLAEVFGFAPTSASWIRMTITSTNGQNPGFGEAAFSVSAIPEPTATLILGLATAGYLCMRRRRQ